MTKSDSFTVRCDPDFRQRIQKAAEDNYADFADHVRDLIEFGLGNRKLSPTADLRRRKLAAEVTARETENAVRLGELTKRDDFIAALYPKLMAARQAIMNLPSACDLLTDEQRRQLDGAIQNLLTDLSAPLEPAGHADAT